MDPSIVISGLTGLGSLMSGNNQTQGEMMTNTQNYYYARELAKYQNQLNMEAWNQQQAYNTPAQQMARFKAAGLNPNLIYGQGNSGNAASPVELSAGQAMQAPHYRNRAPEALMQAASTFLDVKAKMKQLDILDSESHLKENEALISDDEVMRSGYLTYGDYVGKMSFQRGRDQRSGMNNFSYYGYNSPFAQQQDIKAALLNKHLLDLRLNKTYSDAERALQLQRDKQAFELERYTRDPLFYYGNKAIDKLLDFIPKRTGRFNQKLSENQMIDKLRGLGHSVRRGVYKP